MRTGEADLIIGILCYKLYGLVVFLIVFTNVILENNMTLSIVLYLIVIVSQSFKTHRMSFDLISLPAVIILTFISVIPWIFLTTIAIFSWINYFYQFYLSPRKVSEEL